MRRLKLTIVNLRMKFDVRSFTQTKDRKDVPKFTITKWFKEVMIYARSLNH